jgi:hypothetical protein
MGRKQIEEKIQQKVTKIVLDSVDAFLSIRTDKKDVAVFWRYI